MIKRTLNKIYNYLMIGDFSKSPIFNKKYRERIMLFIHDVIAPFTEENRFKFSDLWGRHSIIGKIYLMSIGVLIVGVSLGLLINFGHISYMKYQNEKMAQTAFESYEESGKYKELYYAEKDKNDSVNNLFASREWKEYEIYKESKIRIPTRLPNSIFFLMESEREKYNIPTSIYWRLIQQESSFIYNATSRVGAYGYMQVMPATFEQYKDSVVLDNCDHSIENNIKVGTFYLKTRYDMYIQKGFIVEKAWKLALAAYNAGEGRVREFFFEVPNINETQDYVSFVYKEYDEDKK